jgi:hypothetical protein
MNQAFFLALLAASAAAAEDAVAIWQADICLGAGPNLSASTVTVVNPLTGRVQHEYDGSWLPMPYAGIHLNRLSINHDGEGSYVGGGLQPLLWKAGVDTVESGGVTVPGHGDITVTGGLVTLSAGYVTRWDGHVMRMLPGDWQFDIGPQIGLGSAQARIAEGTSSSHGFAWMAGMRMRLSTDIGGGWRLGGEAGANYTQVLVRWTNTRTSEFDSYGGKLAAMLIYEW